MIAWRGGARPALLAGLALFTGLLAWQGLGEVAAALAAAGWGLLVVAVFHVLPMAADTLAWRRLLAGAPSVPFPALLRLRWIGESVNGLLPVAQLGGNLVKALLLARAGVPGPRAGASVVVDLTLAVATQVLFTLLGLGLLWGLLGGGGLAAAAAVGAGLLAGALAGFWWAQRRGLFGSLARRLESLAAGRDQDRLSGGAAALDRAVAGLYRDRCALAGAGAWRLAGWLAGAGEVWLALWFMGQPVGWVEAVLLESLGQAVRAAAFLVPAALGVQEGGYLVLGVALGLGPELALALALARRARELLLGLPGLAVWQWGEGRRLWGAGRPRAS